MINKKEICTIFDESDCEMRTRESYEEQVTANISSESGIKDKCALRNLFDFCPVENYSVDVMHDLLEGICRYDVAKILNFFIKSGYFNLEQLNNRIQGFDYGDNFHNNNPPEILPSHLQNEKIIISASEMYHLVINLPLIIGDLVPDCEHWDLLLLLKEIVNIVFSKVVTINTPDYLRVIIFDYLTLLQKLYPGSLVPKHHFMVHYPTIMKKAGPLGNISCMRYEAKHQDGKKTARAAISRVNVCRTIAIKNQLQLNYYFMNVSKTSLFTTGKLRQTKLYKIENFDLFCTLVPTSYQDEMFVSKHILYLGKFFKRGTIVIVAKEDGIQLHIVQFVFLSKDKTDFILITRNIKEKCVFYDEHLFSYKVLDNFESQWAILEKKCLTYVSLSCFNKKDSGNYVNINWIV